MSVFLTSFCRIMVVVSHTNAGQSNPAYRLSCKHLDKNLFRLESDASRAAEIYTLLPNDSGMSALTGCPSTSLYYPNSLQYRSRYARIDTSRNHTWELSHPISPLKHHPDLFLGWSTPSFWHSLTMNCHASCLQSNVLATHEPVRWLGWLARPPWYFWSPG